MHPTAAAMASFIGCRLRSLKPSKPSNSSKSLPDSAGKRHPTAAAMASFIGVQDCHLSPFKPLNAPQRPYRLCCGGFKPAGCQPSNASTLRSGPTHSVVGAFTPFAGLQTRQPSAAALHILLVGVQECRLPASASKRLFKLLNLRSGPTDCLVEAFRVPFAGLQTAQPSAAALHSTVLFKRLNPPQRRYTLSCWRLKTSNP